MPTTESSSRTRASRSSSFRPSLAKGAAKRSPTRHREVERLVDEGDAQRPLGALAEAQDALDHARREQVAGLDPVGRAAHEALLEVRVLELDELGAVEVRERLEGASQRPERALGEIRQQVGAAAERLVEVGDEEEAVEDDVALVLALAHEAELGEAELRRAELAGDVVLAALVVPGLREEAARLGGAGGDAGAGIVRDPGQRELEHAPQHLLLEGALDARDLAEDADRHQPPEQPERLRPAQRDGGGDGQRRDPPFQGRRCAPARQPLPALDVGAQLAAEEGAELVLAARHGVRRERNLAPTSGASPWPAGISK